MTTPHGITTTLTPAEGFRGRTEAGVSVYAFTNCTYGCISEEGQAVTLNPDGTGPFFEVLRGSVAWDAPVAQYRTEDPKL